MIGAKCEFVSLSSCVKFAWVVSSCVKSRQMPSSCVKVRQGVHVTPRFVKFCQVLSSLVKLCQVLSSFVEFCQVLSSFIKLSHRKSKGGMGRHGEPWGWLGRYRESEGVIERRLELSVSRSSCYFGLWKMWKNKTNQEMFKCTYYFYSLTFREPTTLIIRVHITEINMMRKIFTVTNQNENLKLFRGQKKLRLLTWYF